MFLQERNLHVCTLNADDGTGKSLQLSSAEILHVPPSNRLEIKIVTDPVLNFVFIFLVKHSLDCALDCSGDLVHILRLYACLMKGNNDHSTYNRSQKDHHWERR